MSAFERDVLVVGAGLADMTAALAAEGAGADMARLSGPHPIHYTATKPAVHCAPVTITQRQPQACGY